MTFIHELETLIACHKLLTKIMEHADLVKQIEKTLKITLVPAAEEAEEEEAPPSRRRKAAPVREEEEEEVAPPKRGPGRPRKEESSAKKTATKPAPVEEDEEEDEEELTAVGKFRLFSSLESFMDAMIEASEPLDFGTEEDEDEDRAPF